jgi:hypothetical protein|nr:MAG TPA: hypothetical protein [Caudoviricetes sp.]
MRFFADRFPDLSPFYKEHWENGKYYAENGEIVLKSDSFADHYLGLKNFQGEDNVELLIRAKFEYSIHKQGLMMVRGSSFIDPGTRQRVTTGYVLSVYHKNGSQRLRLDDNVERGLEVYSDKTLRAGVWTWFRFRAEGTWLRAKAWEDGTSEPSGWDIAVSQSRWEYNSRGANGLSMASGGTVRVNVVSASTLPLPPAVASDFNPAPLPYTLTNDFATSAPMGGFPAGGAYIQPKPKQYTLTGSKTTERLTISRPTLTANGPTYSLRGTRGWVHLVFKKPPPKLTYSPPTPGELRPVQATERLTIRPPTLTHTGPIYALRASRVTERVSISPPTLTAHTAALIQPDDINLRVNISSPSVIFIPKPEVSELRPTPLTLRLTITRTNDLLDPSVYSIEYKQYKPDYVGVKAYKGETLNIDRYRPDTIKTGKIDSIELNTNRYKQIVIK